MKRFFPLVALVSSLVCAQDKALVYNGPGACPENCAESAAEMARLAGLEPVFVGPEAPAAGLFEGARVWIQPGGKSSTASLSMDAALKDAIRAHVREGGAYVGFCAGGFLSTAEISDRGVEGLGLLPGRNALYRARPDEAVYLEPILWEGVERLLYWEGGPYFYFSDAERELVEPTAFYPDASIASVRTLYGQGRVYVTGPHPEAPQSWRSYYGLEDHDGLDFDQAVEMIRWSIEAN
jgi:glutamine amidotransferase-like uncharacterized protein